MNKSLKIAVIGAKGLPAKQGGIEQYCQEFYPRLAAQGYQVHLFARPSYNQKPWFSSYDYQGVKVIYLPSLPLRGLDAFISSALGALVAVIQGYDVVHFHALGPALFCWLPKLFSSAKVVVTCQGLDWQRAKWGKFSSRLIYWGEKTAVKYADEIVVVSQALKQYFQETYGLNTNYIPNGPGSYVDPDSQFTYGNSLGLKRGRYILYLGRLVPEKRADLLIEAFKQLQPQDWKLVLAGGISDTAQFTAQLLAMSEGQNQIVFTNEIKGSNLSQIMQGAGLFVLPSDLEGLPLVMLEAMREGIPVVASDIPPHKQLLGQDRGLLFRAGDVNSLVSSLKQALKQPAQLAAMAERAQEYVKANYSWEKITYDNLVLYAKIAASSALNNKASFNKLKTSLPNKSFLDRTNE